MPTKPTSSPDRISLTRRSPAEHSWVDASGDVWVFSKVAPVPALSWQRPCWDIARHTGDTPGRPLYSVPTLDDVRTGGWLLAIEGVTDTNLRPVLIAEFHRRHSTLRLTSALTAAGVPTHLLAAALDMAAAELLFSVGEVAVRVTADTQPAERPIDLPPATENIQWVEAEGGSRHWRSPSGQSWRATPAFSESKTGTKRPNGLWAIQRWSEPDERWVNSGHTESSTGLNVGGWLLRTTGVHAADLAVVDAHRVDSSGSGRLEAAFRPLLPVDLVPVAMRLARRPVGSGQTVAAVAALAKAATASCGI